MSRDRKLQADAAPVRQFGFVSSFRGPQGNRILLICGTEDMALITLTKLLTRKEGVAPLEPLAANGGSFEALYEVDAAPTLITQARLLVASRPILRGSGRPSGHRTHSIDIATIRTAGRGRCDWAADTRPTVLI